MDITARVTILNIIEIDEIKSIFKVSFGLELKWRDLYLKYNFLHGNSQKNVIKKNVLDEMWIPKYQFSSLMNSGTLFETVRYFYVEKNGPAMMVDEVTETYSGNENFLVLETMNQASFICFFDNIKFYPFGMQKCFFKIFIPGIDNKLTKLIHENFLNVGPKSVGEYQIIDWKVRGKFHQQYKDNK